MIEIKSDVEYYFLYQEWYSLKLTFEIGLMSTDDVGRFIELKQSLDNYTPED
jgi:hypothetical protein